MQLRSGGLLLLLAVAQAIQYFPTQDAVDLCANVDLEESSVSNVDDSPAETVLLPFMFPFFGSLYERVFLNPNGAVQLDASLPCGGFFAGGSCSRDTTYFNLVAPYLEDLNPGESELATVVRGVSASCARVEFRRVPLFEGAQPKPNMTFSVSMDAAGLVTMAYEELGRDTSGSDPPQGLWFAALRAPRFWSGPAAPAELRGDTYSTGAAGYYVPWSAFTAGLPTSFTWCPLATELCLQPPSGANDSLFLVHAPPLSLGCGPRLALQCVFTISSGGQLSVNATLGSSNGPIECDVGEAALTALQAASSTSLRIVAAPTQWLPQGAPLQHGELNATFSGTGWTTACGCDPHCAGSCLPTGVASPYNASNPCARQQRLSCATSDYGPACASVNPACTRWIAGTNVSLPVHRDQAGACCNFPDMSCDGFCASMAATATAHRVVFPGGGARARRADTPFCCPQGVDCAGVCGGSAAVDSCGVCAGDTTGKVPNADLDCFGLCFTNATDAVCDRVLVAANASVELAFDARPGAETARHVALQFSVGAPLPLAVLVTGLSLSHTGSGSLMPVTAQLRGHPAAPSVLDPLLALAGGQVVVDVNASLAPVLDRSLPLGVGSVAGAVEVRVWYKLNTTASPERAVATTVRPVVRVGCDTLSTELARCSAAPGCMYCSYGDPDPTRRRLLAARTEPGAAPARAQPVAQSRRQLSVFDIYLNPDHVWSVCVSGESNQACEDYLRSAPAASAAPMLAIALAIASAIAATQRRVVMT